MKTTLILLSLIIPFPVLGQTMYKCPDSSGVIKFQQMPCTPTGGGEALPVKKIPAGAGSGLSGSAKEYMADRDKYWDEKAKAQAEERKRQDALDAEHRKAKAAEDQAAAQRATAAAIWATGRR